MSNLFSNITSNLNNIKDSTSINYGVKHWILNLKQRIKFRERIRIKWTNIQYQLKLVKILPLVLAVPKLAYNYAYDFKRFIDTAVVNPNVVNQIQLKSLITMDYHRLEKGLALKEPRIGFGSEIIKRLISNLWIYHKKYGLDETGQIAINVLCSYHNFSIKNGLNNAQLHQEILALKEVNNEKNCTNQGGVLEVTKQQINEATYINFQAFVNSRYSIRHFAPIDVEMYLIEQAVEMAQKTPSVCNRQSSKLHVFSSEEDKKAVLICQNGNRGFGDQASKVLIVTSDLQYFISTGERNQGWIDGGMFAMSLIYALHSLGLGTCCLNWSVEFQIDEKLRNISGIKDSELIIMMIAVGHLPTKLKVAQSPRKKLHDVMIVH
ncbi:nitroreductase family protein [Nostoc sp. LEGE 06077]|uniref:nitroreductase family protein n=1 Tax=Nostoc sp. LEGE 06077 TaxID=915325 RepID=UPI001D15D89C|nr:nitroreductase family protein [Nostoc sp. LEGE 06077]